MLGRKKISEVRTVIELSDESRQALVSLDADVQALQGLMGEVIANMNTIIARMSTEVITPKPEEKPILDIVEKPDEGKISLITPVPGSPSSSVPSPFDTPPATSPISQPWDPGPKLDAHERTWTTRGTRRMRKAEYTRHSYREQDAWIKQILANGEWRTSVGIAQQFAKDKEHYKYLRAAVGGRLTQLYKAGILERRDSKSRTGRSSAYYEYRLKEV